MKRGGQLDSLLAQLYRAPLSAELFRKVWQTAQRQKDTSKVILEKNLWQETLKIKHTTGTIRLQQTSGWHKQPQLVCLADGMRYDFATHPLPFLVLEQYCSVLEVLEHYPRSRDFLSELTGMHASVISSYGNGRRYNYRNLQTDISLAIGETGKFKTWYLLLEHKQKKYKVKVFQVQEKVKLFYLVNGTTGQTIRQYF